MDQRWLVALIVIIIIVVLIIALAYLSIRVPGLFISWRHDHTWLPKIDAPFLTHQEVDEMRRKIEKLPVRWVNSTLGTIGVASYIDDPDLHLQNAKESNKLLMKEFPNLHQKLIKHLEKRYYQETGERKRWRYPGRLGPSETKSQEYQIALPGIHVFSGTSLLGRGWSVASVHVDKQEERAPLPTGKYDFDFTKTYSFTIPLTLPRGTGLYIINAKENDVSSSLPLWWSLRNKTMQKIEYQLGHCYFHHGKYFHCIAPFYAKKIKEKDGTIGYEKRITIQGHAVYCSSRDEYWVYW